MERQGRNGLLAMILGSLVTEAPPFADVSAE